MEKGGPLNRPGDAHELTPQQKPKESSVCICVHPWFYLCRKTPRLPAVFFPQLLQQLDRGVHQHLNPLHGQEGYAW